jgi:hypothetical protein
MRGDTMMWAGPLPDDTSSETTTLSGQVATIPSEAVPTAALPDPIVWAGALPPVELPVRFVFRDRRRQFMAGAR